MGYPEEEAVSAAGRSFQPQSASLTAREHLLVRAAGLLLRLTLMPVGQQPVLKPCQESRPAGPK